MQGVGGLPGLTSAYSRPYQSSAGVSRASQVSRGRARLIRAWQESPRICGRHFGWALNISALSK
eukprot:4110283-Pyramimonas_sp.AAC.1